MKKYIEVNLKSFILSLPLSDEIQNPHRRDQLTPFQIAAVKAEIKEMLNDPSMIKRVLTVQQKSILAGHYIHKKDLKPGRIVRTDTDELGIVTGIVNKRRYDDTPSVSVVLQGHRILYFEPTQLMKVEASFEEVRCVRFEFSRAENLWHEGDTGYIFDKGSQSYVPVVVGKTARGKVELWEIYNGSEEHMLRTWRIPVLSVGTVLKEFLTPEEAEKYISIDDAVRGYRSLLENTESEEKIRFTAAERVAYINHLVYYLQPKVELSSQGREINNLHKHIIAKSNPLIKGKYQLLLKEMSTSR